MLAALLLRRLQSSFDVVCALISQRQNDSPDCFEVKFITVGVL
jgi:hypothetical protein